MLLHQKASPALLVFWLFTVCGGKVAASAGAGHAMLSDVATSLSNSVTEGITPNTIVVEVYYKATCSNCLAFFQNAVLPLLWAGLPEDRVSIRLMPWVPNVTDDNACLSDLNCYYARDHMCALKDTYQQPVSVNSTQLSNNVQFVYCDLYNVVHGDQPQMVLSKLASCAQRANLPWEGSDLKTCSESGAGFGLLQTDAYQRPVTAAKTLLDQLPGHMAPFILLDGQYVVCDGPQWCVSLKSADTEEELSLPGTLLRVVCSKLFPVPMACTDVILHDTNAKKTAPAEVHAGGAGAACENCAEVGSYHWRSHGTATGKVPFLELVALLACTTAVVASLGGLVLASRFFRQRSAQDRTLLHSVLEGGQSSVHEGHVSAAE